ncbi:MAG: DegV family EDD domain-containing protein [Lachnospiraceae bacterium]|nr:DegV family EDD domain-containing protein [Lachnospiraceae bacterium]
MLDKWIDKLFGEEKDLREIIFQMILAMGIVAAILESISALISGEALVITLLLLLGAGILGFTLWLGYKYHKIDLAALIVEIVFNLMIFPAAFFVSGGVNSGVSVWFVLGIVYVFLLFKGWKFYLCLFITVMNYIAVYYVGYIKPEWITTTKSTDMVYIGSASSVIIISIVIGGLIKFHTHVYETERKRSEQQKEEIQQMSQAKSKFFANMSHEIRTPINTIIGLNEMTLREEISDEIAENSINIQNASKILLALINDILDLSKIESAKMEIVPVQYETGAMFSDLVNLIWIRAHAKKLDFKIDISKDIPSMLYGDEIRIKQILTNLLTNAVKYTQTGSIKLTAQSEQVAPNTVQLRISVSDTGMGIRKEDIANVFTSFKRVDETINSSIEGTGLGLAISKQLIEMMGGKITVDSIYTKGSVFTVILNQKIVDSSPLGNMDFMLHKKLFDRKKYRQRFEAPEAKVLIVDDNAMNLMVACKLLRGTKVQIDTASSGKECLEKAKHKMYNVIFMDHIMPDMDGVKTLQKLRNHEKGMCQKVPVIALTANAMSGAEEIYERYGFQGYLAKPVNSALFEAMLLKYLPKDLVIFTAEAEDAEEEQAGLQLVTGKRKKSVVISTDCVCDLPEKWFKQFHIRNMYCYVYTNEGRFCDLEEISSDNLLDYMKKEENQIHTTPASVEEYEAFFADALEEAEKVIHISLAKKISKGYQTAVSAAKGFDNVTVVNSGHLSSGMGLLVMYAVKMAEEGCSAEEICKKLKDVKNQISTSFIVPSTQYLYQNGRIGKRFRDCCEIFALHPVLTIKRSKMLCCRIEIGRMDKVYKKYIRREMKNRGKIRDDILFVTHCGCSLKQQQEIKKEVERYMKFKYVVFQKSSATISSNCGLGTFGLIYLKKGKLDENETRKA